MDLFSQAEHDELAQALDFERAEDLLRAADRAMYRTKQNGRHGYTLFNHELRCNQADQLALETLKLTDLAQIKAGAARVADMLGQVLKTVGQ